MSKEPKGRNDGHEFDHSVIEDKIIIGSDLCKGGVCKIHGEEFKKLGVSVEINLSKENNELPPKDIETYLWLPTVDGYAPSVFQLNLGTCAMNHAVTSGKRVYVHCRNGHGRSPTLVAAYLIAYRGLGLDEAIKLISQKRPEIHIEENQHEALVAFARKVE
ncbi:MAG: dual specificity protein phosphatase family protein [Candidatus Woesebacteria bacterium]|jgi:protein-tyrosine phosphatase